MSLPELLAAIRPADENLARRAGRRLARGHGDAGGSAVARLARRLAAARHSLRPRLADKAVIVCAADHGWAEQPADCGATAAAVRHLASGRAALNASARGAKARLVIVDCGVQRRDPSPLGCGIVSLPLGSGTKDIRRGPAMSAAEATRCLETGIALLFAVAGDGLDIVALGAIGRGSAEVSAAVVATLTGDAPDAFGDQAEFVAAALRANRPDPKRPVDVLAKVGGTDLGVLAGIIAGAAAIQVPVVLDAHATWAAALLSVHLAPAVRGYLIASHAGNCPPLRRGLAALSIDTLVGWGVSHGEGSGSVLVFPLVDAAERSLAEL